MKAFFIRNTSLFRRDKKRLVAFIPLLLYSQSSVVKNAKISVIYVPHTTLQTTSMITYFAKHDKIRKQTIKIFGKDKKRLENRTSKKLGNETSLKSTPFLINHTECKLFFRPGFLVKCTKNKPEKKILGFLKAEILTRSPLYF